MKDKLLNIVRKFESNTYIKAVSGAMTGLMPVMIVSSIASLVASINIGGSQAFMEKVGILTITSIINSMTIDIVSIYAAFLIGFKLAEQKGKDMLNSAIMSTLAFFILTPLTNVEGLKGLATSNLGAGSMFVAIFGGLAAASLYMFLIDKKITIKMPDSIPPVVRTSFSSIIPGLVIAVLFGIVSMLFAISPFGSLQSMLLTVVSIPLKSLGSNIIAVMIIVAFIEFLWFFGMHGVLAVYPILMLVFYQPGLENLTAFSQKLPLPHLFTMGFVLGNRGARSLAVSFLCLVQAKSERMRAVGKIGIVPALFGISEPVKFGIPQVMNIKMLLPLMLTPAVSVLIAYILTIIGFLPYDNGVSMPMGSPVIISGFFNYGWQGIVSQFLQLVACTLIYIPFIRAQDNTYFADEQAIIEEIEKEEVLEGTEATTA